MRFVAIAVLLVALVEKSSTLSMNDLLDLDDFNKGEQRSFERRTPDIEEVTQLSRRIESAKERIRNCVSSCGNRVNIGQDILQGLQGRLQCFQACGPCRNDAVEGEQQNQNIGQLFGRIRTAKGKIEKCITSCENRVIIGQNVQQIILGLQGRLECMQACGPCTNGK